MPVPQKLKATIDRITPHGERVYTLALRPERRAPAFRAGQSLHLALDSYDATAFWPESRVFSIASSPDRRDVLQITYAVHGAFTERMEHELREGREIWLKMPYGEFVVDTRANVALFAGGTGVTAFTAFLAGLEPGADRDVTVAYGARHEGLLIYRDLIEACVRRVSRVEALYFLEGNAIAGAHAGLVSVDAVLPRVKDPGEAQYYISGPPPMLQRIGDDLRARGIGSEAIHVDAWE